MPFQCRQHPTTPQAPSDDGKLERFYRQWALKEAYIKAIGSGLTFSPRRIEITGLDHSERPNSEAPYDPSVLRIDGLERPDWRFKFAALDDGHVACVSRGPPSDAIDDFRQVCMDGCMCMCVAAAPRRGGARMMIWDGGYIPPSSSNQPNPFGHVHTQPKPHHMTPPFMSCHCQVLRVQHLPHSPLRFGLESVQPGFDVISLRELIPQDRLADFDASLPVAGALDSPVLSSALVGTSIDGSRAAVGVGVGGMEA